MSDTVCTYPSYIHTAVTGVVVAITALQELVPVWFPRQHLKSYPLICLKNNGGLVITSTETVTVQSAEKAIQRLMNIHSVKNMCSFPRVLMVVREMLGNQDVLNLSSHIVDTQHGIDNHFTTLMFNCPSSLRPIMTSDSTTSPKCSTSRSRLHQ